MTPDQIKLSIVVILVGVIIVQLMNFEQHMLYYPQPYDKTSDAFISNNLPDYFSELQKLAIPTDDNHTIKAWYLEASSKKETVVFAHGNAGTMEDRFNIFDAFARRGYGVLFYEYRGYGDSPGKPHEKNLVGDFIASSQYLEKELNIPINTQIAVGESLGGAVAIQAAAKLDYRAILVFATFTTALNVFKEMNVRQNLGFINALPIQLINRQRYASIESVKNIHEPLLIVHGDQDQMMSTRMPNQLAEASPSQHTVVKIIESAAHNDVFYVGESIIFKELEALLQSSKTLMSRK